MTSEEIGQRVKDARRRRGTTQEEMAAVISGTQTAYSRKERGEHWFSVSDVAKMASYFGCTTDYLLLGKSEPTPLMCDEEWRLVRLYRKAPEEGKRAIMDTAVEAIL